MYKYMLIFVTVLLMLVVFCSPEKEVTGSLDVNVDQQNRGTVVGKVLYNFPYHDPNGSYYPRAGVDIRFSTGDYTTIKNAPYRTTSNSGGDFLIELPAGVYNIYCLYKKLNTPQGDQYWYGSSSVVVARGNTVDVGEIYLTWEKAYMAGYF